LTGYVKTHNSLTWSEENTHQSFEHHLHNIQVDAWCIVTCKKIIEPKLFNKNLNSELYINLIIRDIQRIDKLLERVALFITRYAMYYNVTFRRVRAFIIAYSEY
jgi:hypothetical protein